MSEAIFTNLQTEIPIRSSTRAKTTRIVVYPDGRWEVVVPTRRAPSLSAIQRLVVEQWEWIQSHVSTALRGKQRTSLTHQGIPRQLIERQTRERLHQHLRDICAHRAFSYQQIRLGNYSSQWGSCSREANLSFHYKLSLLPEHLSVYVVAHELCHTVHFDHSPAFWRLLETLCSNAKQRRKELRTYCL